MDLELGTSVGVGVATLLLVPIVLLRMQRSGFNPSQPKYKRGITMMGAILLLVHVVLCIKEFKEHEDYRKTYQLGMRKVERVAPVLLLSVLFMIVVRACWGQRNLKHKSAIIITGAMVMLGFAALFMRKSTPKYVPATQTERPHWAYQECGPRRRLAEYIVRVKPFKIRDLLIKLIFLLFVSICVSLGI